MHGTHGCAPARKALGAIGFYGLLEIRKKSPSCNAIITCVLLVLCVFLRFLAQYNMNPYVHPMGFGCSAGPCRHRTGFGTTYGQSCRPVWGKYMACRIHMYRRLLDHARLSKGPRLQRINKHSTYFKTYFVSFRENRLFVMLHFTGVTLIDSQYLTSYTR